MARQTMPKWTKAPVELVALFSRAVESLPEVETRQMFGYPAAFVHGNMFSGLFQSSMVLRLPAEDRERFLRDHGAHAFEPMAGRPMREYAVVPEAVVASPNALRDWLDRAHRYAASLPRKQKAKQKAKKKAAKKTTRGHSATKRPNRKTR